MPCVSVIVPVYNAENSIEKCVYSILGQAYTDFELLLINDGSTDESLEICKSIIDSRIMVFDKPNEGVSATRNFGIDMAQGEYIVFVDSDDFIDTCYLSDFMTAKDNFPEALNIWCGFKRVSAKDYVEKGQFVYSEKEVYTECYRKFIMDLHEKWLDTSPWNKLFDAKTLKSNNIKMDTSISLGEDWIFNFDYLDKSGEEIIIINKPNYNYVTSDGDSLSSKYIENMFEVYKHIHSKIISLLFKWSVGSRQIAKFFNAAFWKYEVVLCNTMNKKNRLSFFNKIRYNNKIIKSAEFKDAFAMSQNVISKTMRFAYFTKNYFFIFATEKILGFFSRLKKRGIK